MLRVFPLLLFACAPAVFTATSAPVPREARPEFGASGLLTRADLERVAFRSHVIKDGRHEEKRADAANGPAQFDVAVHMPLTTFRQGEPIPAYFVLKNLRDRPLRLGSRMNFLGRKLLFFGDEAVFDIRDRSTGETVRSTITILTHCGGGSMMDVPANGFSVLKADLNRVVDAPLAPGEYEVDWEYQSLSSAPVRFTVVKADAAPAARKPLPGVRFYRFVKRNPVEDAEFDPPRPREDFDLVAIDPAAMSAALAVGQCEVYVPDSREIPASDMLIEASVLWKPHRDADRIAVTLSARARGKTVRFADEPELYLQVESGSDAGDARECEMAKEVKDVVHKDRKAPMTVEVRLPRGWREQVGTGDRARIAVLVASQRLEMPQGRGERIIEAKQDAKAVKLADAGIPVWEGIVRTPFTEIQLPAATP